MSDRAVKMDCKRPRFLGFIQKSLKTSKVQIYVCVYVSVFFSLPRFDKKHEYKF